MLVGQKLDPRTDVHAEIVPVLTFVYNSLNLNVFFYPTVDKTVCRVGQCKFFRQIRAVKVAQR